MNVMAEKKSFGTLKASKYWLPLGTLPGNYWWTLTKWESEQRGRRRISKGVQQRGEGERIPRATVMGQSWMRPLEQA